MNEIYKKMPYEVIEKRLETMRDVLQKEEEIIRRIADLAAELDK